MDTISYTQARKNFAATLNKVYEDQSRIIITRQSGKPVVIMSLEDYNAIEETLYLVRSSKNAARLAKVLQSLKRN